jgi:hypothetical protein
MPRLMEERHGAPVLKKLIAAHEPRQLGAAALQDLGRLMPYRLGLGQPERLSRTRALRVPQIFGEQAGHEHPMSGADAARQGNRPRFDD